MSGHRARSLACLLLFAGACRFCEGPTAVPLDAVIAHCSVASGDVRWRPSNRTAWDPLAVGKDLSRGDWVQTAEDARAEVDFVSGLKLAVDPGSLVIIEDRRAENDAPIDVKEPSRVSVVSGSVHATIGKDAPARTVVVATSDGREVRLKAQAESGEVDYRATVREGAIEVAVLKGAATLSGASGAERALTQGQVTQVSREGVIAEPSALLAPPALGAPADAHFVTWRPGTGVTFSWAAVPGAGGYLVELSPARGGNISRQVNEANANLELPAIGSYRWRVATRNAGGSAGAFSAPRALHAVEDQLGDRLEAPPEGAVIGVARGNPQIDFRWKAADKPARYRIVVSDADHPEKPPVLAEETQEPSLSTRALDVGNYRWVVYALRGELAVPLFESPRRLVVRRERLDLRVPDRLDWGPAKGKAKAKGLTKRPPSAD